MSANTIICVTPNAALDRTLVVPDFAIGQISRIPNAIAVPGGKGLNVLRAVEILGGRGLAMGLLGGHTGKMIAAMLDDAGCRASWTRFEGETRTCTIIAKPDHSSTVINEEGQIAPGDWMALADDICQAAAEESAALVCLCGSLPIGAPDSAPADLIMRLKAMGVKVWVDSSQQWLRRAIAARPYAIKVNRDEILAALGAEANTRAELLALARRMNASGIAIVVISLGAAGALLVSSSGAYVATPPAIQPVDAVASGDCLHAGLVTALANGEGLAEALRQGVAAGTVNALYAGGAQFTFEHYQRVLSRTSVERLPG